MQKCHLRGHLFVITQVCFSLLNAQKLLCSYFSSFIGINVKFKEISVVVVSKLFFIQDACVLS